MKHAIEEAGRTVRAALAGWGPATRLSMLILAIAAAWWLAHR